MHTGLLGAVNQMSGICTEVEWHHALGPCHPRMDAHYLGRLLGAL